jgi:hypothetical protein
MFIDVSSSGNSSYAFDLVANFNLQDSWKGEVGYVHHAQKLGGSVSTYLKN